MSHETIYQALYVQGRGGLRRELTTHLRTGRTRAQTRRRPGERRGRIPGMVMISERPAEVEDRAVPGHWEGDLILGSTASGSAIGTLVERTTRYVILLHLPGDHTALTVQEAMVTVMADLPETLRRTLTWDQGSEMANHARITAATGLDIYFCDPHSPWQRGTTRTPTGCCASTSPKAPTCPCTAPGSSEVRYVGILLITCGEVGAEKLARRSWRGEGGAEKLRAGRSAHPEQPRRELGRGSVSRRRPVERARWRAARPGSRTPG